MLSFEQAAELARIFLAEKSRYSTLPMDIVEEDHALLDGKIYFDCQSIAYLKSGNPSDMVIGTGYICVDGETGDCRMLGAVESVELNLFEDDDFPGAPE
ncbi:hypothetical protein EKH77_21885 [Streptomyces luteoverticillatus]|uniref:Immunity protein 35 domain-containing protein n=1 Tax=Streptomyces luteoverticillatus TaxID=66425 RepID=A0A3Q9G0V7_STRLT|nr:hypothetical protein [Streptomyces luteoverticillatus]AZQ73513.1 hypothetical protein EKH77_21885 [Streptomyces luteoverticillatus]